MATNFEFLPRSMRRLHFTPILPGTFLVLLITMLLLGWHVRETANEAKIRFDAEAAQLRERRDAIASQTWALVPAPAILSDLEREIQLHNLALGGIRTPWGQILSVLESELPPNAVVAKVENAKSGTRVFPAGDLEFRLLVVLANAEDVNEFYRKLSARREFQALTFSPKGEQKYLGRTGSAVEIAFRFEGTS